jgi:hypothetical protein
MNQKLTEQIAYHILANLGVLPASFIDSKETRSILDKQFILSEKISFETLDGDVFHKNIYGCQIVISDSKEFKLLLADCTQEKDVPEYCLLTQLKDAPAFGVYFIFNQLVADPPNPEALISVNTNNKHWIPCSTYLQATFLAGMEQIRDLGFGWTKCTDYKEQYNQLLSLIKFHDNYFGED